MSAPVADRTVRDAAEGVLEYVRTHLAPSFAVELVRSVLTMRGLAATETRIADAARQLPDASSGRDAADLDLVAAELVTPRRGPDVTASYAATGDRCAAPCAVAGTTLDIPVIDDIDDLSSDEDVTAAAVLAVVYQCGDRMQAFRAVDAAIGRLGDTEHELYIDDPWVLDALSCWHEIHYRVGAPERATLAARVLGLSDPHLPKGVLPDPLIQGLLNDYLDAVGAACDPGPWRVDRAAVARTAQLVRVRLSSTVTGASIMRIKQLQVQWERARQILVRLAPHVPGHRRTTSEWVAVGGLLGSRLPDGTDLTAAHAVAEAWRTVFTRLASPCDPGEPGHDDELCAAAALLRPRRHDPARGGR